MESVCDYDMLVLLGGSSAFEKTLWHFPKTRKCPFNECGLTCSWRKVALQHFVEEHAGTTMVCFVCNTLFSAESPTELLHHYKNDHPSDMPPRLKSVIMHCAVVYAVAPFERMINFKRLIFYEIDGSSIAY